MKICPICDGALHGSYCPTCRHIVAKPWILPDGVYLNRAHSAPDVHCEFHAGDRVSTLLNRRHPQKEEHCSYHRQENGGKKKADSVLFPNSREEKRRIHGSIRGGMFAGVLYVILERLFIRRR